MRRGRGFLCALLLLSLLCALSARGRSNSLGLSNLAAELDLGDDTEAFTKVKAHKYRANRFSSDRKDDEFFVGRFAGHQARPFEKKRKPDHLKDYRPRDFREMRISAAWTTSCNWALIFLVSLGSLLFICI